MGKGSPGCSHQIPKEFSILPADFDPLAEMEFTIAHDIVTPLTFLYNYLLPFPGKIVYNSDIRRFFTVEATLIRKIVCALWMALILWRIGTKICSQETSNGVLSSFVKVAYVVFILYCVLFFAQLWTKGQAYSRILNEGIDVSSDLFLKFQSAPRTRLVFLVTHLSWAFSLTFSFTSHVLGGIIAIVNEVTGSEYNNSNTKPGMTLACGNETETNICYSLNELEPQHSIVTQVLLITANFLNTFCWMISFLYVGIWAVVFRQLFSTLFWKIDSLSAGGYELNLSKEIRTFNKIAALVDKYNSFNGLLLLLGATVIILYISTSIEQVVTGVSNISQFRFRIHLFLSYAPLMAAALMTSELHRKASSIGDVIKKLYNSEWNSITACSRTTEALYGIAVVHHDISMSNIGFKGLGFFTVTYQFVVTMLSVIITYALVAIQWFPQFNPTARQ